VNGRGEGPRLKIERADEHIDNLDCAILRFRRKNPYTVIREDEPDSGDAIYRARVTATPPVYWATFAGDAAHNLRSALDLLIWQLVLANSGTPGKHTMFPIAENASDYKPGGGRYVSGICDDAKEVLDALKPYKGGNDALWRLHRLDANDKHQLLAVIAAAYESFVVDFTEVLSIMDERWAEFGPWPMEMEPRERHFPLIDGDVLLRVESGAESEPDTYPKFVLEIALSDGEVVKGEPVIPVLRELSDYTKGVIEAFSPFL
jgi:hypothetical protein